MNKILKILISCVIIIVVCYFIYFFYGIVRYSHSLNLDVYKQYLWVFKDSVKKDIDTNYCYSYVKKQDVYNNIHFKGEFNIIIWEFKDLVDLDLRELNFTQNSNLYNIKFRSGEILNKKSDLEIVINYGFKFNKRLNIAVDTFSKIQENIKSDNFKGFFGSLDKICLFDEKEEPQILLDYENKHTPTLFLAYKGHRSFYLILINSKGPFDEKIIKILNLK